MGASRVHSRVEVAMSRVLQDTLTPQFSAPDVAEAFSYCERLARSHYENFPVGSLLVPKSKRRYVYAIYAFARIADDFADEDFDRGITDTERLASLEKWEQQLKDCVENSASHPVFVALAATIHDLRLPISPFLDLLSAFKQDVTKRRYRNFEELLDYCARSANPVGRLILLVFDYHDERLGTLSDSICTALQLTNFWQDVSVDLRKDRIYLPVDEMEHWGITEGQLRERRLTEGYTALLAHQVQRTRHFFERGEELPMLVAGRLRYELRFTWLSGVRILDKIERQGFNTLTMRPTLGKVENAGLIAKTLLTRL